MGIWVAGGGDAIWGIRQLGCCFKARGKLSRVGEDVWAVSGRKGMSTVEDIWLAISGWVVKVSGVGEDMWVAILRREVRISGWLKKIWVAILKRGPERIGDHFPVWVKIFGWRFQGGDCGYRNPSDDICMAVRGSGGEDICRG